MAKTPRMNIYGRRLTPELVATLRECASDCMSQSRAGRVANRDFRSLEESHTYYCRMHTLAVLGLAEFRQYNPREEMPWSWYVATPLGKRWLKKYDWMCRRRASA